MKAPTAITAKPASYARGAAACAALRRGVERETATIVATPEGWRIDANDVAILYMTALAHTQADVDALAVHLARQGIRVVREGC